MAESIGSGNVQKNILDNPGILASLPEGALQAIATREHEAHLADVAASGEVLAAREEIVANLQASLLAMGEQLNAKDVEIADLKSAEQKKLRTLAVQHEMDMLNDRISRYEIHASSMISEIDTILRSGQRFDTFVLSKLAKPIGQMRAYVEDLEIDNHVAKTIGLSKHSEINSLQQRLLEAEYRFKEALNDLQTVSGAEGILPNMFARIFSNEFTQIDLKLLHAAQNSLRKVLPPKAEDNAVNG